MTLTIGDSVLSTARQDENETVRPSFHALARIKRLSQMTDVGTLSLSIGSTVVATMKRAREDEPDTQNKQPRVALSSDCTTTREGSSAAATASSTLVAPTKQVAPRKDTQLSAQERIALAFRTGFLKAAKDIQSVLHENSAGSLTKQQALAHAKGLVMLLSSCGGSVRAKKWCVSLLRDLALSGALPSRSCASATILAASGLRGPRVSWRQLRLLADVLEFGDVDSFDASLFCVDYEESHLPFGKQLLSPRAYGIVLRRHPYLQPRWYRYGPKLKESAPSVRSIGEYVEEFARGLRDLSSSDRDGMRPANLLVESINTTRKRDEIGHALLLRMLRVSYENPDMQAPLTFLDRKQIRGISDALLFGFICDGYTFETQPMWLGHGPCDYEEGAMTKAVAAACNRIFEAQTIASALLRAALPACFSKAIVDIVHACRFSDGKVSRNSIAEIRRNAVPQSRQGVVALDFEAPTDPFICGLLGKQVSQAPLTDPEVNNDVDESVQS